MTSTGSTSTSAAALAGGWVDRLVPADPDPELARLLDISLKDNFERFQPGPLDQGIIGLVAWFLRQRVASSAEHALVLQLPRGTHDISIFVGLIAQLFRLHAANDRERRGTPQAFNGSIIVTAMDSGVQSRLKEVSVPGLSLKRGLAEALGVFRVRADGDLVHPNSHTIPYRQGRPRVLYHNIRVGWPALGGERDGLAVIDRSTISRDESFEQAIAWARSNQARRFIVINDLGDQATLDILEEAGITTSVLPVVPEVLRDLKDHLGSGDVYPLLSTNALIEDPTCPVDVYLVDHREIDRNLRQAYAMLSEARRRADTLPYEVSLVARLLSGVSRCVDDVDSYNRSAAADVTTMSMRSLAKRLETMNASRMSRRWRSFAQTTYPRFRDAALKSYEILQRDEPKRRALLDVLDQHRRSGGSDRIRIRVVNRAAARSLRATLDEHHSDLAPSGRVSVHAWSERLNWCPDGLVEVLVAPPPKYRRALLWSGESSERIVLAFPSEVRLIEQSLAEEAATQQAYLAELFGRARLGSAPSVRSVFARDSIELPAYTSEPDVDIPELDVDLDRIVEGAQMLADTSDDDEDRAAASSTATKSLFGEETVSLVPIHLTDNSTWWIKPDATAETLVGDQYFHRLVEHLEPGDQVIVPRGEGREALFTRLVAARHRGNDMQDLDQMLSQFRRACWKVYRECGENWAEVHRSLERAGCSATHQARAWADGSTIAPADPEDVKRIARLARDSQLEKGWFRIDAVAQEVRRLHRKVGNLLSGALTDLARGGGEHLSRIEELLGDGAEVLDEFVISTVDQIGEKQLKSASLVGAVTS